MSGRLLHLQSESGAALCGRRRGAVKTTDPELVECLTCLERMRVLAREDSRFADAAYAKSLADEERALREYPL